MTKEQEDIINEFETYLVKIKGIGKRSRKNYLSWSSWLMDQFGIETLVDEEGMNEIVEIVNKYNEYIIPDMIPFRFSAEELSEADKVKYFGKKEIDNVTAYYLKKFDSEPVIRHVFKNGEDGEDGSEVDATYFNSATETGVSSFTEICLTVTKKDVREWFKYNGNIEESRVNTIGLFSAVYDSANDDYANIQLFSKLNIPT